MGAVPAEVLGICDAGRPESGETPGSAGRVLRPGGSAAALVPVGSGVVEVVGVPGSDLVPGDAVVLGSAVVPEVDEPGRALVPVVAEGVPAAVPVPALPLPVPAVPALPLPVPALPWASITAVLNAPHNAQPMRRDFVFMVVLQKFSAL